MAALLVLIITVSGMVLTLLQDRVRWWSFVLVGVLASSVVGGVLRGRKGLWMGMIIGGLAGVTFLFLYVTLWMIFSLPPHPEVDF